MLCVLAGVLSRPAVSSNDQELLDADLHGYDFDDHDAEVFFADSSSCFFWQFLCHANVERNGHTTSQAERKQDRPTTSEQAYHLTQPRTKVP